MDTGPTLHCLVSEPELEPPAHPMQPTTLYPERVPIHGMGVVHHLCIRWWVALDRQGMVKHLCQN